MSSWSWGKWCRFVQLPTAFSCSFSTCVCFFMDDLLVEEGRRCQKRSMVTRKKEKGVWFLYIWNLLPFLFLVSYKGIETAVHLPTVLNHACYAETVLHDISLCLQCLVLPYLASWQVLIQCGATSCCYLSVWCFTCIHTEHLDFIMALQVHQI